MLLPDLTHRIEDHCFAFETSLTIRMARTMQNCKDTRQALQVTTLSITRVWSNCFHGRHSAPFSTSPKTSSRKKKGVGSQYVWGHLCGIYIYLCPNIIHFQFTPIKAHNPLDQLHSSISFLPQHASIKGLTNLVSCARPSGDEHATTSAQ